MKKLTIFLILLCMTLIPSIHAASTIKTFKIINGTSVKLKGYGLTILYGSLNGSVPEVKSTLKGSDVLLPNSAQEFPVKNAGYSLIGILSIAIEGGYGTSGEISFVDAQRDAILNGKSDVLITGIKINPKDAKVFDITWELIPAFSLSSPAEQKGNSADLRKCQDLLETAQKRINQLETEVNRLKPFEQKCIRTLQILQQ